MRTALLAFVALGGVGCGNAPPVAYSLTFPTLMVPAGTERTQCIVRRLGNSQKLPIPSGRRHRSTANYKNEADFLSMGNADISLPPNTVTTLGSTYFPMSAADLGDVNVFALTGHEHHLGTGVTVSTATSASDGGKVVYDL